MDLGTINVIDNKDTLSFKITSPKTHEDEKERGLIFTTGIRGFLSMVKTSDEEGFGLIRLSKVIYNGIELNSVQKMEFWNQLKEKEVKDN